MSKKPVEIKGTPVKAKNSGRISMEDIGLGSNSFALDPALKKELADQGLEPRFLSIKEIEKGGGFHPMGWKPYTRKTRDHISEFQLGKDVSNSVRRGDLILGVKEKESAELHRQYLNQEALDRKVSKRKTKAEFREYVKSQGIGDLVDED